LHPLIAVAGPTGAGKSGLAIRIAQECGGEVVNCDSVQVYRGLTIGTAKVPPAGRGGIPHHLVDILEPEAVFTAGDFARVARGVLGEITARGRVPVVAGGTGFYLKALIEGLAPAPTRNETLRRRLARRWSRRPESLHGLLESLDPAAARAIHSNDGQKLIRAIEVCLVTRRPASTAQAAPRDALQGYRVLNLALNPDRRQLYERIGRRCSEMFAQGLIEEVRELLAGGVPADAKPLSSIGYAEALAVLRGEINAAAAIELAQRATRHYAKRQWSWFRRTPGTVWIDGFGDSPEVQAIAVERVKQFLAGIQADSAEPNAELNVYTGVQTVRRPPAANDEYPLTGVNEHHDQN
jgi:tRNA dimethylallyltransferase